MSITLDWTDKLDKLIYDAILAGRTEGKLEGVPDSVVESGLAHVFFYGDKVFKLYKTYADKDHFIKGVFAPTKDRTSFMDQDYAINRHFSEEVYLDRYSVHFDKDTVIVTPYDGNSIYKLIEMRKLDFSDNLHEQLLRDEVRMTDLHMLGHDLAKSVDTYDIEIPDSINWYDLAKGRVELGKQFVDWLPDEFSQPIVDSKIIDKVSDYLEENRDRYKLISGNQLAINVDNHDENVFIIDGKIQFIDLLPPLSSWWYGVPYSNLSSLMTNVEVLASDEAAQEILKGYQSYYKGEGLNDADLNFTRALTYIISIAHFGSVPGKEDVTNKYIERLDEVVRDL